MPPGDHWGERRALEQAVHTELLRRGYEPRYGLTENGYELDFVVVGPDGQRLAIQVCADPTDPATRERALADTEDPTERLLITLFTEDQLDVAGQTIPAQPAWKWFLTTEES